MEQKTTAWQRWLQRPQNLRFYKIALETHLLIGATVGLYIMLMSITGSIIVYRDELSEKFPVEWIVNLHQNLLLGKTGRFVNGVGALTLTLLCFTGAMIWWPGVRNWRRGLTVNWKAHLGRVSWDLHSALGFWFCIFILIWGLSGAYFAFSQPINTFLAYLDPHDRFTDPILAGLSSLHFGRFNSFTQILWSIAGLVPAALASVFVCCRRIIYKETLNPHRATVQSPNANSKP